MPFSTWETALSSLRNAESKVAPSLLISEMQMRWNNVKIGDYRITPLKEKEISIVRGHQIVHDSPYSRLVVLSKDGKTENAPLIGVNIGLAMSSIMSFTLRSLVISYDEFFPPLHLEGSDHRLSVPGELWVEGWQNIFERQEGLRRYLQSYVPSPQEEENLVKITQQVYEILMKIEEEKYQSIMGALRLYQMAYFIARIDYSLAYSLLVAAVDAASSSICTKTKLKDIDPEGKLKRIMEELQFDGTLQNAVNSIITHHKSLTKRISNFILENLPSTFWEGDYSMVREAEIMSEHYWSGQFLRDLSKSFPEPLKQELIRQAEEHQRVYKEFKKKKSEVDRRWIFNKEQRKWMISYLRDHLDRVLTNTFGSRSELFHFGKGFPKFALREEFHDWIPDVFEEDFPSFSKKHVEHTWDYSLDKGRIFRTCSCGDREEVKVMFGICVFERIVHDSILNYILGLAK
jgi:hypothetical protein